MIIINKDQKELIRDICKLPKPKANPEILRNVLLIAENNRLTLKATDLTVELTRVIPVEVESGFQTTVNASKLMQAVNATDGDIKLIASAKDIQIKSGRRKFTLPTIDSEAYPAYPEKDDMIPVDINSLNFAQSVKSVAFAKGVNDVRYMLNGLNISERIQATDGFRLAWLDSGLDCNFTIPGESLVYLPGIDGGKLSVNDNIFCIAFDDYEFKTRLVDGKYPNTERLIPSHEKQITVNRDQFIDATKAAMITANEKSRNITIVFNGEKSIIKSSNSNESAVIEFDCDCAEEFEVSFNSSYLLDALNALSSDIVTIECEGPQNQVLFKDSGFQSLIMPVKV